MTEQKKKHDSNSPKSLYGMGGPFGTAPKKDRRPPNVLVGFGKFVAAQWKMILLAGFIGLGYNLIEHGKDLEQSPKSSDLAEVTDNAITKFSPLMVGYAERDGAIAGKPGLEELYQHRIKLTHEIELEEFCENVQEEIKDKYVGKNGIVDFSCSIDEIKITMEDGSVVTATPRETTTSGPASTYYGSLEEAAYEALVKHTTADDYYYETFGFSSPHFYSGTDSPDICNDILEEVQQTFNGKIKMECTPYQITFKDLGTREVVTAIPQKGITVTSSKKPPRPGS